MSLSRYQRSVYNRRMDIDDLNVFCIAARRASFAAAAKELGTTPAHVSKRIAILEAALSVRLFHRTTRRVVITSDGEIAFEWARRILEDVASMTETLQTTKGELSGLLRISTSLRFGRLHVSPILSLLGERYPKLDVWLEVLDRRTDLVNENIDIDLRFGDPVQPQLIAHRIASNRRILVAAPSYLKRRGEPKLLADLAEHECLLYREREQAFGTWRLMGPKGVEAVKVTSRFGSNMSDVVRNWCLDGKGICLLSVWDIADAIRARRAVQVLPQYWEPADIWAVLSTRSVNSAKVRVCLDFLKEQLSSGPHALDMNLEIGG